MTENILISHREGESPPFQPDGLGEKIEVEKISNHIYAPAS